MLLCDHFSECWVMIWHGLKLSTCVLALEPPGCSVQGQLPPLPCLGNQIWITKQSKEGCSLCRLPERPSCELRPATHSAVPGPTKQKVEGTQRPYVACLRSFRKVISMNQYRPLGWKSQWKKLGWACKLGGQGLRESPRGKIKVLTRLIETQVCHPLAHSLCVCVCVEGWLRREIMASASYSFLPGRRSISMSFQHWNPGLVILMLGYDHWLLRGYLCSQDISLNF